jgi:uncharacterized protein YxjI
MKRENDKYLECFSVLDVFGNRKYKVIGKNFRIGKKFFLIDSSQTSLAFIRKLIFPFISNYLIKSNIKEINLFENRLHKNPSYNIGGIDWIFKNSSQPYVFSVTDKDSQIIMKQVRIFKNFCNNYEIEIINEKFEIVCLCISVCVNNLILNDNKICELT